MKLFYFSVLLCIVMLGSTGCSTIPFSHSLRVQQNLTDQELKNLQYYISRTIKLSRSMSSEEREVTSGHKLLLKDGQYIEEVVIKKKTPGIAEGVGPDWLAISFEPGSSLVFQEQRYESGRISYYEIKDDHKRKLEFDGKTYDISSDDSYAYLLIGRESLSKAIKERRVLPGRRLD